MPYRLEGNCVQVKRGDAWENVKCHPDKAAALAHFRALQANVGEGHKQMNTPQSIVAVFKQADGSRMMALITTNAYKDRDGDIITEEALKAWVDQQWVTEDQYTPSPLLFWHIEEQPIGDVIYSEVNGRFLLELAQEQKSEFSRLVWDTIEQGGETWGASHGFRHSDPTPRGDGRVFKHIDKFETSVLPVQYAANAFTFAEVKGTMADEKREEYLARIPGALDALQRVRKGATTLQAQLDAAGVEHKDAATVKGYLDKMRGDLMKVLGKYTEKADDAMADEIMRTVMAAMADGATEGDVVEDAVEAVAEPLPPKDEMASKAALISQIVDAQAALLETQLQQASELKALREEHAVIVKENSDLRTEIKALRTYASLAPRQASKDPAAVVTADHPLVQEVQKQRDHGTFEAVMPGLFKK